MTKRTFAGGVVLALAVVALAHQAVAGQAAAAPADKWDYACFELRNGAKEDETELKASGLEGWELVTSAAIPAPPSLGPSTALWCMKRRIP